MIGLIDVQAGAAAPVMRRRGFRLGFEKRGLAQEQGARRGGAGAGHLVHGGGDAGVVVHAPSLGRGAELAARVFISSLC